VEAVGLAALAAMVRQKMGRDPSAINATDGADESNVADEDIVGSNDDSNFANSLLEEMMMGGGKSTSHPYTSRMIQPMMPISGQRPPHTREAFPHTLYNRIKEHLHHLYAFSIIVPSFRRPPWCVCINSWIFVAGTQKNIPEPT
jgi:hypothetical protein